ncbi:phosphopantothenate-cysteine ligase [Phellopilus nigrolimitatus]|nr:phosphopantothenate-cysteine ligase [Phellopilus nigrolimitatus]
MSAGSSQPSSSDAPFSAESYFTTQPPPSTLDADVTKARAFIARHAQAGRKVVLVTSGGTTVPLELNVVRFLDNFSAGTRGATSAEYFLRAGYAVIFMHRQHSLQPFSRHYSHSTNPFLDFLELEDQPESSQPASAGTPTITVHSSDPEHLRSVLSAYKAVHRAGTLHTLTFVNVNEYLWLLRAVSKELSMLGRRAMYYLAAAVSDFFLPREKMSEHKIQSGKGSLILEMDQVPKILKPMVDEWTPEGFVVSFKLETDTLLLVPKARAALERYGHQVVIGNELHRRKYEVVFVARTFDSTSDSTHTSSTSSSSGSAPEARAKPITGSNKGDSAPVHIEETWLRIDENSTSAGKEIEEDIVDELVRRHLAWAEYPSRVYR